LNKKQFKSVRTISLEVFGCLIGSWLIYGRFRNYARNYKSPLMMLEIEKLPNNSQKQNDRIDNMYGDISGTYLKYGYPQCISN